MRILIENEMIAQTYNSIPIFYVDDGDTSYLSFGKRMATSIPVNSYEEANAITDMILNRDESAMFADPYRIGQWLENKGYTVIQNEI